MTARVFLICLIISVVAYGIYEVRLWSKRPDIISVRQRRIRSLGLVFLLTALVMWMRGTYLHVPQVHGHRITASTREAALRWIGYWTVTFLTLVPLIPLALLDTRENLRRASEERRRLRMEALSALENLPESPASDKDGFEVTRTPG